ERAIGVGERGVDLGGGLLERVVRLERAGGHPRLRGRVADVDLRRCARVGQPGAGVAAPPQRGLGGEPDANDVRRELGGGRHGSHGGTIPPSPTSPAGRSSSSSSDFLAVPSPSPSPLSPSSSSSSSLSSSALSSSTTRWRASITSSCASS